MRLKHLKLQGYKSFATKTEFLFPTGITTVVGPNGSGKSNIADAIRWALGERSMSILRAKSTADMIFAGGQGRARAGMAEVSLTFDNADGALPIEFSEVTITRRAYRSGENRYLINGARVLLRDITELLAESGLSERTYTVIGQGLVDTALALRPDERRTLFEEAAGISLYRDRREKTIERLDETERNLERVYDIISEITPRLKRLRRNAQQVEQHRRLTAHLRRLQRTWYGYKWGERQTLLTHALEKASALGTQLEKRRRKASELSERLDQLRQRERSLRPDLRDWYRESADLHEKADAAQRELAVSEERGRLLEERRKELLAEIEPLRKQREQQAAQVTDLQERVDELDRELTRRKRRLMRVEQEWQAAQKRVHEHERRRTQVEKKLRTQRERLEQLNQELIDAREDVSRLTSEQAVVEERARQLESRREEVLAELKPLSGQEESQVEQIIQCRAQLKQLKRELAAREKRLAELEQAWSAFQKQAQEPSRERLQTERALRAHRAEVERVGQVLHEAREEEARLTGELKALSRMQVPGGAYDTGVRALLQADLDGVLGPLAALIQVPSTWERAVEAALGGDLQAVIVERVSLVDRARQVLEAARGRLTLLPLDGIRPPSKLPPEALCAADVVTCEPKVRPAVETMLGSIALCDDLAAARALLPLMPPGSCCATTNGLVVRADGAVTVGQIEDTEVLANERARRELPTQLKEVRRCVEELEDQQRAEVEQVKMLQARLEEINRQTTEAREEKAHIFQEELGRARTAVAVTRETLRSQQAELRREEALLEQVRSQRVALRKQASDLKAKHIAALERAQVLEAAVSQAEIEPEETDTQIEPTEKQFSQSFRVRLEKAQQRCYDVEVRQRRQSERTAMLEAKLEQLGQQVAGARKEAARVERETLGKARTDVAVTEESLRSSRATLKREKALLEQLRSQIDARQARAEELGDEQTTLASRVDELRQEASRREEKLREIRKRIQPAEEELEHLGEKQTALEKQVQQAQDRMRDAEAHHGRAELKVERRYDELHLLAERIEEDLGLVELELAESVTAQTPLPIRPLVSELPVVEKLPEGLEEEMKFINKRLRRLGAINPNAPDEYVEVEERHSFLTEQSADLEAASAQLRQTVAELDDLMSSAFEETFSAVASRFSGMFTDLFGGGEARLELVEPDDLLNTGVDIIARPPGKRAQRLALLSGGERALTAVALLFSLLYVSPTPFCVLDEVDAMLDEANVGRFRVQLEKLAEDTQFIVITHNRGTVESAETIYGISMGSDAVSQVVSLKMEEATAISS